LPKHIATGYWDTLPDTLPQAIETHCQKHIARDSWDTLPETHYQIVETRFRRPLATCYWNTLSETLCHRLMKHIMPDAIHADKNVQWNSNLSVIFSVIDACKVLAARGTRTRAFYSKGTNTMYLPEAKTKERVRISFRSIAVRKRMKWRYETVRKSVSAVGHLIN